MGKMSKKIEKNKLTYTEPINAIKAMLKYRNEVQHKNEDMQDILDKLHLSLYTYDKLNNRDITGARRYHIGEELYNRYILLMKGKTSKQKQLEKMVASVSNKKVGTVLVHDIEPLLFNTRMKSYLKYENFKYIFCKLDREYADEPIPGMLNTSMLHEKLLSNHFLNYVKMLNVKLLDSFLEDESVGEDTIGKTFIRWCFWIYKADYEEHIKIVAEEHLNVKDENIINLMEYDKDRTILFSIMSYIMGINSTYLEGDDSNISLFEGVGGENFRKEHIRMKLLHLIDTGVIDLQEKNNLTLVRNILFKPIICHNAITDICDQYGINRRALTGMYQPLMLNDEKTMYNTISFKKMLKYHDNFIKQ